MQRKGPEDGTERISTGEMKRLHFRRALWIALPLLVVSTYVLSYAPVYLSFTFDVFGVPKSLWPAVKAFYEPVDFLQSSTVLHDPLFRWWGLWCEIYLW